MAGGKGAAVVCIVRDEGDEGDDIFEWVLYHSLIGFRTVFVFDNGSVDHTRTEIMRAARVCDVRVTDWPHHPGQNRAYNEALTRHAADYDAMMFCDADEFVVPVRDGRIDAYLDTLSDDWDHIGAHWAIFGSSGHEARPAGLTCESYLKRAEKSFSANRHIKTLTRTAAAIAMGSRFCNPHLMQPGVYIDPAGPPLVWLAGRPGGKAEVVQDFDVLRIHHYYSKSRQDFAKKMARGWADSTKPRIDMFAHHDRNDVLVDTLPRQFGDVLDAIREANATLR